MELSSLMGGQPAGGKPSSSSSSSTSGNNFGGSTDGGSLSTVAVIGIAAAIIIGVLGLILVAKKT